MKRLAAFLMALALMAIAVLGVHASVANRQYRDADGHFSRWYNMYKDRSADALRANITDRTMVVFGSSEFGHLKGSRYHVANMFSPADMDMEIIAQPGEQCLYHAIALGALAPEMKRKQAVLMISPTWFRGKGVKKEAFQLRFSDSLYIDFLKNPAVSGSVKKKAAKRCEKLLAGDKETLTRARIYRKAYLDQDAGAQAAARVAGFFARDQENASMGFSWKWYQFRNKDRKRPSPMSAGELARMDWKAMRREAAESAEGTANNPIYASDRAWKRGLRSRYEDGPGRHARDSMVTSREYGDLRLFLQICREEGIRVKLIVQPVNGYWYDYCGLTKDERDGFHRKIARVARQYGAEIKDLTAYDYKPYVLTDAVHPWKEGWLLLDEGIYDFYKNEETVL